MIPWHLAPERTDAERRFYAENIFLRSHLESLVRSYDDDIIEGWEIEVARRALTEDWDDT